MATDNVNIKINVDATSAVKQTESYKKQLADLKAQMTNLKVETDNLTKASAEQINEYNSLLQKAGAITDALSDTASEIKSLSDDYAGLTATMQGIGAGVAGITAVQGAMALFGSENEAVAQTIQKVQGAMALLNSVNTIAKALDQSSTLMTVLRTKAQKNLNKELIKTNTAETAGVGAMGAYTTAEGVATAGAGALTVGIHAVSTAIKSIPVVGWILAAIAALTTLITLIVNANDEETEGERLEQQRIKNQQMINDARAEGIRAIQKDKIELDSALESLEKFPENTKQWSDAVDKVSKKLGVSHEWVIKNQNKVAELAKTWLEVAKVQATADELTKRLAEARANNLTIEVELAKIDAMAYDDREQALEDLTKQYGLSSAYVDKLNKAMHQRDDSWKTIMKDMQKDLSSTENALEGALKKETELLNNIKVPLEEAQEESKKLDEQLNKANKSTATAVKATKTEREKAEEELSNFIEKNIQKNAEAERKANEGTYEGKLKNIQNEIDTINATYDAQILKAKELYGEESAQVKQLEQLKIDSLSNVENKRNELVSNEEQKAVEEELKKQKTIAETKIIGLKEGSAEYLTAYTDLLNAEMQLELNNEKLTEEEKEKIRLEYQDKIATANDAFRQSETEKDLAQVQAKYDAMTDIVSAFSNAVTAMQDAELANAEGDEKKQAQIKKKYAKANFLSQIAGIGIDTAKGIMSVWSTAGQLGPIAGPIVGAIQTAMIAATGIAQTAKARAEMNNALKAEKGGLLHGPLHSNGGIPVGNTGVEVEGGEFIVNRKATSAFEPLLSAINSYGYSSPAMPSLYNSNSNTVSAFDKNMVTEIVQQTIKGVSSIPVVVTEHSITKAQRNVSVIESQALL